jgi:thioredoxin 2
MVNYICPNCTKLNTVPEKVRTELHKCSACKTQLHTFTPAVITEDNFEDFLTKSDFPVILKVEAQWCGPCQMMKAPFEQVASETDTLLFATLDIEKAPQAASELGIRGVPAIIFFIGGKEVARDSGAKNVHQIKQWLVQTINSLN